jgi:molybdenum storage protein
MFRIWAETVFFIKDEKGLYTDDPKKNAHAEFIPRIHLDELIERDLGDLIIERVILDYMKRARFVKRLVFINGLEKGAVSDALKGIYSGTEVYV